MNSEQPYPTPRIQDLAVGERPQERLEKHGPGALSDSELIAMLLRSGRKGQSVMGISQQLITAAGSLAGLTRWRETDFRRIKGIGRIKALQLITVMEIARRALGPGKVADPLLNRPELVHAHFASQIAGLVVEKFWVLCLNRKNRLIRQVEVTSGTATSSLAHPREVFREAVHHGASAVVCVHNHPSGDPAPSAADVQVTRQLRDAARALDIDLLDHVIVGQSAADPRGSGYYSFREAGVI
ncbi:MAG TPA: DNA repair protein RadC [Lacunisphaera sp.]|nr:DNA repair protein RadC [Lacunisphaera sp.]